jgi:hypothetical protein
VRDAQITYATDSFGPFWVRRADCPAFAARYSFDRIETKAGQVPERTDRLPLPRGPEGVRSILHDRHAGGRSDFKQMVHVHRLTGIVYRHNRLGTGRDPAARVFDIEVQVFRPALGEYRHTSGSQHRLHCRSKGHGRDYDLCPAHIGNLKGEMQSRSTGGDRDAVVAADKFAYRGF